MRRLIVVALILWLPLQAWAAAFAPGCGSPHSAHRRVAAADATAPGPCDHHAAHTAADSLADTPGVDQHAGMVGDSPCADGAACCMAAGVALAVAPMDGGTTECAAGAPLRADDEDFASAPASPALEPPIAAA